MSITSSSSNITEESDASPEYNDSLETTQAISGLLEPYYQTENTTNKKSALLTTLIKDQNLSHAALAAKFKQEELKKFKRMLLTHFFNNLTCSNTYKRDYNLDLGITALDYRNFKNWFPEFVSEVIDYILKIDYVKKKNLHFNATLNLPFAHGTKHSDMMDFLVRLIFTFFLSPTGEIMTKHFLISHPEYDDGKEHAMAIGCHEFVVMDSKASGSAEEWKDMKHQAKAPGCELITVVVTVPNKDLPPGLTLPKFMEDLGNTGFAFETVNHMYYNRNSSSG